MIVNLYVDHMMSQPATSSDDVLAATQDHSALFAEAARKIGLTPSEYREFRASLLDGNAMYVRLPRRVDAMSANHHGNVYVVKNAVVTQPAMSWRVPLHDGNIVYVPQICGNISLVHHAAIAVAFHRPKVIAGRHAKGKFIKAIGMVAETPVSLARPAPVVPIANDDAPASIAAAAPLAPTAAAHGASPFFYAIPAVFAAIVAGATHHDSPTLPSCDHGSNLLNVCQK